MLELDKKRKVVKILSSPVVLIFLAIILFFLFRGVWNIFLKDQSSILELNASKERLAKLQARQGTLVTATSNLSTESGIENEIRDRFQMAKVGEKEIVIVENSQVQAQPIQNSRGLLQKVIDFFTIR